MVLWCKTLQSQYDLEVEKDKLNMQLEKEVRV
jgi:hypothetical protein